MLTGAQKAWMSVIVGTLAQVISVVAAVMVPASTAQIVLLTVGSIVGIVGQGFGVYQMPNTPKGFTPGDSPSVVVADDTTEVAHPYAGLPGPCPS